jgi:hypothetical protein
MNFSSIFEKVCSAIEAEVGGLKDLTQENLEQALNTVSEAVETVFETLADDFSEDDGEEE